MSKVKIVLEYDTSTHELFDTDGISVIIWDFDIERCLHKESVLPPASSMVKEYIAAGVSVDDIIKLKNAGVL